MSRKSSTGHERAPALTHLGLHVAHRGQAPELDAGAPGAVNFVLVLAWAAWRGPRDREVQVGAQPRLVPHALSPPAYRCDHDAASMRSARGSPTWAPPATTSPILSTVPAAQPPLRLLVSGHGTDPTHHGTGHTREQALLLLTGAGVVPRPIPTRESLSDLGATVAELLGVPWDGDGTSFVLELVTLPR